MPLPDPVLMLCSLAHRWNTCTPAALATDDALDREPLGTIVRAGADMHTVRVQVGRDGAGAAHGHRLPGP